MGITFGTCFVGPSPTVRFVLDAIDETDTHGTVPGMDTLSGREVLAAVRGFLNWGGQEVDFTRVSTDSRLALPGDLFVALIGERFDGHEYIAQALEKQAAGIVYQQGRMPQALPDGVWAIEVADTLVALGDLAAYYRRKLPVKVIGITGSLGKTTTKGMAFHLLRSCAHTVASPKSFNNSIGLPMTLFQLSASDQYAVLEMGTNSPGEIRRLAEIGRPEVAVITSIAPVHTEGLGDLDGIAREKADIVHYMTSDGTLMVNGDDPLCRKIGEGFHGQVVTFGCDQGCDVRAKAVERTRDGIRFVLNDHDEIVLEHVRGLHNVYNALAAAAVYLHCGFDASRLPERFRGFRLPPMRLQLIDVGERQCLCDCYNANPRSMAAALDELASIEGGRPRAALLGDMAELGDVSQSSHERLGRRVAERDLALLVAVGPMMRHAADAAVEAGMSPDRILRFDSAEEVKPHIGSAMPEDCLFLLKGSRSMKLESVLQHLRGLEP